MNLLQLLTEFLFPRFCLICGQSGAYICLDCRNQRLNYIRQQRCHICNQLIFKKGRFTHLDCAKATSLDGIIAVVKYDQKARKIIRSLKYGFVSEIAKELAPMLALKLRVLGLRPDYLIPVPLFKERQKWRGFNQSELLAAEIGYPRFQLERIKKTHTQVGFNKAERQLNLADAFAISPDENSNIEGSTFLLIDDVATTGSTLEECANVLKAAGAARVFGLVWARD